MVKKKQKYTLYALLVLIIVISVLAVQPFALFTQSVWIPQYLSASCDERVDHLAEISIPSHTDEGKFYHCTSEEAKKYVPIVNGVQCQYIISNFNSGNIQICKGITENKADLKNKEICSGDETALFGDKQTFTVDAGNTIYINTNRFIGDATLKAKYPSFGLKVETETGLDLATTTSCELTSLSRDYHTVGVKNQKFVAPDEPFDVVAGLQLARSTRVVTLKDVEGGKVIHIARPRFYNLVTQADDGFLYVDTTTKEFEDSDIECYPRTTGCSDEAKIISIEDQSCSIYGGAIINYAPIEGDSTKLCKYSCSGGTLSRTNDCIAIQKSCPPDKPLWDTTTGQCTSLLPVENIGAEKDLTPLFIVGIAIIIIIFMILIAKKKGKI